MSSPPGTGRRPNILFFMTDQQRWDAMGCSGGWVRTPNLDHIASMGVRYVDAFTNSPVCRPARVSLATGLYPRDTGLLGNRGGYQLSPERPTWMRALRDAGYRTSVFGKTHLHPVRGDLRDREHLLHAYGLDDVDEVAGPRAARRCRSNLTDLWEEAGVYGAYRRDLEERRGRPWVPRPSPLPFELYPDVYVGTQARRYLESYDRDQPWFCWVSFPGPHEPWDTPEPYASMHRPQDMPPPVTPADVGGRRPRGMLDARLDKPVPFAPGEVARMRADYAGNVTLIDDQIGQILEVVERRGELDGTIVAFVSDHGEMNGDWGLIFKQNFLDGAVRVPFLVAAPGMASGATSTALVELMDLGPTLLDLVGAEPIAGSGAQSLRPTLQDPGREHRDVASSEYVREVMVATHDLKVVMNERWEPYLVFDRTADPQETRNLVSDDGYHQRALDLARRVEPLPPAPRGRRRPPRRRPARRPLPRRVLGRIRRALKRSR